MSGGKMSKKTREAIKIADGLRVGTTHQKQFAKPQFETGKLSYDPKVYAAVEHADERIHRVVESAQEKDYAFSQMKVYTKEAIRKSKWLNQLALPKEEAVFQEMDKATMTFEIESLSSCQKTKRGKKFKKKALQQASMINIMQQCRWQRKEALKDLLEHGKNARLGWDVTTDPILDPLGKNDTQYRDTESKGFLVNVDENLESEVEVNNILTDLSFYYEQKRGIPEETSPEPSLTGVVMMEKDGEWEDMLQGSKKKEKKPEHPVTKYHYKPLELIVDPKTREDGYKLVLEELEKLDLSSFEYKSNEEFIKNEGEGAFVKRYAALQIFSKCNTMLHALGEKKLGKKRYSYLLAKASVVGEILEDYNMRSMLLQSPYYVLMAGKDLDSISDSELRDRMDKTNDVLALNYMDIVMKRRHKKSGFRMGVKTDKLMKETEKQFN